MTYGTIASHEQFTFAYPAEAVEVSLADNILQAQAETDHDERNRLIAEIYPVLEMKGVYAACRSGARPADVDDRVSEGVLKMLEKINEGAMEPRTDGSVVSYLTTAVRNSTIDGFRRNSKLVLVDTGEELADEAADNNTEADALEENWNAEQLVRSANLPGNQARVIELHIIEGKSIQEVARELDMTDQAVKSCVHRGVVELRDKLARTKAEKEIENDEDAVLNLIHDGPVAYKKPRAKHKRKVTTA